MSRKSHQFGHAEDIIREYWESLELLRQMRGDKLGARRPRPEVAIFGRGGAGDDTARRAFQLALDPQIRYLTDSTQAVTCALEQLRQDKRYPQIHRIIDLYYWQGTRTAAGAGLEAGYSERQAKRLKNLFVRAVMQYLGWI